MHGVRIIRNSALWWGRARGRVGGGGEAAEVEVLQERGETHLLSSLGWGRGEGEGERKREGKG